MSHHELLVPIIIVNRIIYLFFDHLGVIVVNREKQENNHQHVNSQVDEDDEDNGQGFIDSDSIDQFLDAIDAIVRQAFARCPVDLVAAWIGGVRRQVCSAYLIFRFFFGWTSILTSIRPFDPLRPSVCLSVTTNFLDQTVLGPNVR